MVCSGLSMGVDEDPYDYVMRRSAEIVVTINPTCAGPDPRVEEEALIADMKAYADSLSFGGMPGTPLFPFDSACPSFSPTSLFRPLLPRSRCDTLQRARRRGDNVP